MLIGSGIDLIEVERIQAAKENWQERFLQRVFTQKELAYANSKGSSVEHLAARFAIKEAMIKALSVNGRKYSGNLRDIEVSNDKSGRPYVTLHGNFKKAKEKRGIKQIIVSAAHTHRYAVASVILSK